MKQIVKINTALSDKPYFVKVDRSDYSLDQIFTEAVKALKENGNPLESKQLEHLYDTHQMFNAHHTVQKGSLLSDLVGERQVVADQEIQLFEIDLITSHAGG